METERGRKIFFKKSATRSPLDIALKAYLDERTVETRLTFEKTSEKCPDTPPNKHDTILGGFIVDTDVSLLLSRLARTVV